MTSEQKLEIALEALEIIAGNRQCFNNLMSNQDVALNALSLIYPPDGLSLRKEHSASNHLQRR